jgi:hypothetical protein
MYFVAAVRVGDVLSIRHKPGEPLLRLFLGGIGDIAEVRRYVGRQLAFRDHRRDLRAPGSVRRQHDQGEWTQWPSGADLVKAAIDVDPFKGRVQE